MAEDLAAQSAMLAVETKIFPLYEIIDGTQYRITYEPQGLPVSEYLKIQAGTVISLQMMQPASKRRWTRIGNSS